MIKISHGVMDAPCNEDSKALQFNKAKIWSWSNKSLGGICKITTPGNVKIAIFNYYKQLFCPNNKNKCRRYIRAFAL